MTNPKSIRFDIPLFQGLTTEELRSVMSSVVYRPYKKGDIICSEGDKSTSLGLLFTGQLSTNVLSHSGREVGLSSIVAPAHFGELSAVDGLPRSATLVAKSDCKIGWINKRSLDQLRLAIPNLNINLSNHLCDMIRRSNKQILLLSVNSVFQRVCLFLLNLPYSISGGGIQIIDRPSHKEIASILNTSRESVSRAISELESTGIVSKQAKTIIIADRKKLERLSMEE